MKDYRNYIIPALILIIILFWFDRGNNRKELKTAGRQFEDSISTLISISKVQETEILKSKDTIRQLKAGLQALQLTTAHAKTVKVKVLAEPKIIVPDSIMEVYAIVKERLEQDSSRISALQDYSTALEHENYQLNKVIRSQEFEIKAHEAMNETKDLMIDQLNARHEVDQELYKNERKLKRKWMVVSGGLTVLLVMVAL